MSPRTTTSPSRCPARDLSGLLTGTNTAESVVAPLYFMTEDDITRGITQKNVLTGAPFDAVSYPSHVESVIATLPTGDGGSDELWKLNHYYERLDDWNEAHGIPKNPFAAAPADPIFELHNLSADPEERTNRVGRDNGPLSRMQSLLDTEREAKRRLPSLRNPVG